MRKNPYCQPQNQRFEHSARYTQNQVFKNGKCRFDSSNGDFHFMQSQINIPVSARSFHSPDKSRSHEIRPFHVPKMLGKRDALDRDAEEICEDSRSNETLRKEISRDMYDANFNQNCDKIHAYLRQLPGFQRMSLFAGLKKHFSLKLSGNENSKKGTTGLIKNQLSRSDGSECNLKKSKFEPGEKDSYQKCAHVGRVFKRLLDLKNNLYNRREQTAALLDSLKACITSQNPGFSGHLKGFLLSFLCSESAQPQFKLINAVDRILFLAVLIKKQFRFSGIRCFCWESLKAAEGNETKKRNDELVKFYISRLFKQIAREIFPRLRREKDQMRKFYVLFFGPQMRSRKIHSTWYKNALMNVPNNRTPGEPGPSTLPSQPRSLKEFLAFLHELESFSPELESAVFHNRHQIILGNYKEIDMSKKLSHLMFNLEVQCVDGNGEFGLQAFAEMLSNLLINSKIKLCFSFQEINKASQIVLRQG